MAVGGGEARERGSQRQKDKLQKEYAAEKAARQQSLSRLQTELEIAKKDRKSLEAGRADLEKDKRDAVAAMNATQKNLTDYRQERDRQRTELLEAQQDRDEHFKEVVALTDELNQAVNEKELLRKRTARTRQGPEEGRRGACSINGLPTRTPTIRARPRRRWTPSSPASTATA